MEFQYQGMKVQQKPDAPSLYMLQVPAEELLDWADVPRKKADFMAGYQRELSSRHKKIKDFLELDENNVIPGALLVAVGDDAITVDEDGNIVDVEISYEERDLDTLIEDTYQSFYSRLDEDEQEFVDQDESDGDDPEEEDRSIPSSYLAELTKELKRANENFEELPEERQEAVRDYVTGVSRPGRILDGQHRVFGAKEIADFDVKFPVVLMPGMSESEQVFHFYVVNNKARPLKKTELRATVSTSLTNAEIEDLYERFRDAGVRAEEAQLTFRMHRNPDSPFANLIDFGLEDSQGVIDENVAHQVVMDFVKMGSKFRPLYADVDDWDPDPEFDYRLKTFYAFWRAIKEVYQDAWEEAVEEGEGQILQKVTLLQLQELVLERLKPLNRLYTDELGKDQLFANHENLEGAVENTLEDLPEEFFTREWQMSGLDTSDGHDLFKEQMEKAMSGAQIGKLKLFRDTN
ncbi:ParB N-terminal domain-containing protein [Halorussus litoreus]|uniref:hypothetical protein n=1 Tax=Halorussus litoreus TaxID=1710536 RepID=UPI0013003D01|nr:hypothetical protein [Halorussus litoreus]